LVYSGGQSWFVLGVLTKEERFNTAVFSITFVNRFT
jgi:hypothetical protein